MWPQQVQQVIECERAWIFNGNIAITENEMNENENVEATKL